VVDQNDPNRPIAEATKSGAHQIPTTDVVKPPRRTHGNVERVKWEARDRYSRRNSRRFRSYTYHGIGRLGYTISFIITIISSYFLLTMDFFNRGQLELDFLRTGGLFSMCIFLTMVTAYRLRNIGSSASQSLLLFVPLIVWSQFLRHVIEPLNLLQTLPVLILSAVVPVIGLFVVVRCIIVPEDYAQTRKLDRPAFIMAVLTFIALLVALVYFADWYYNRFFHWQ
jgi:hypothetical protein